VAAHEYFAAYDDLYVAIDFSEMVWYGTLGQPLTYNFVLGSASTADVGGHGGPTAPSPSVALALTRLRSGTTPVGLRVVLPWAAAVRLQIYDVMGRRRRTLLDGPLPAGATAVDWDGRDESGAGVHSGMYFARLSTGRVRRVVKVPLLR
jgi:hypothetical protein